MTAPADQSSNEGSSALLNLGSFSDPGVNDNPWTVDVNWGDGSTHSSFTVPDQTPLSVMTHTYDDNGSYTVTVKVTDKDGGSGSNTFSVAVANVAPTASITGAPASSPEGTAISLGSTVTDPSHADTTAGFTYAWSVTKNGNPYGSGGSLASFSFTPDDNGTYVVSFSATDKDHGTGTDQKTITVTNVAPTASITGAPGSSPEGTAISLGSTVTDPSSVDYAAGFTYAWSVTKNGNPYGAGGSAATFSFTPNDNASYVVTLTATDKDGGVGTDSKTITVTNVSPTASITGAPATSPEGTAISLGSTVTDPSSVDTAAGFTYAWSVTKNGNPYGAGGSAAGFSFTPDDNGTYVVTFSATDKDGGVGNDSKTITVTNVAPAVTAPANQSSNEGENHSFSLGSFSDPGVNDNPWAVDVNWGDGSTHTTFNAASQGAIAAQSHTYIDGAPTTYTVTVKVTDKDHDSDSQTFTVTVANVSPTITSFTGTDTLTGVMVTATSTFKTGFSDPGLKDALWTAQYQWDPSLPYDAGSTQPYGTVGSYRIVVVPPECVLADAHVHGGGLQPEGVRQGDRQGRRLGDRNDDHQRRHRRLPASDDESARHRQDEGRSGAAGQDPDHRLRRRRGKQSLARDWPRSRRSDGSCRQRHRRDHRSELRLVGRHDRCDAAERIRRLVHLQHVDQQPRGERRLHGDHLPVWDRHPGDHAEAQDHVHEVSGSPGRDPAVRPGRTHPLRLEQRSDRSDTSNG